MFCGGFGYRGYSGGFNSSGLYGGIPFIMMGIRFLIMIGIIVLAVHLFRKYTSGAPGAIKLLNESFAKGEISEEEYIKRKTILLKRN